MRRANQNVDLVNDNGNLAISFGYDFCAEHEWGIAGIQRTFGVSGDESDVTIGRIAITRADAASVHLIEAKNKRGEDRLYLLGGVERFYNQTPAEFVTGYREAYDLKGEPTSCWDKNAFMFSLPIGHKRERNLRSMHKAIMGCDALIYRAASGLFGGSGLVIARRSTLPPVIVQGMEDVFADHKRLKEASDATGIVKRVEEWGRANAGPHGFACAFFALSPKWMSKDRAATSRHPVIYWLNPYDQQNNNYGHFTVEELEQWMDGKGPIPMTAAQKQKKRA